MQSIFSRIILLSVWFLTSSNLYAATAQDLLPLTPYIEYQYNNLSSESIFVVPTGRRSSGRETYDFIDSSSYTTRYSNDSDGLYLYQEVDDEGDPFTYNPPVKLLNANPQNGDILNSSGTVRFNIPGLGVFIIPYTYRSQVIGEESVTVPLGTFTALRVSTNLAISGTVSIQGQSVSLTISQAGTTWLAENQGVVRQDIRTTTSSSVTPTEVTNESNRLSAIVQPPEINSPTNGSTLPGISQAFNWLYSGNLINDWWLYIGTTPGANDIEDTGSLGSATRSFTSNVLPTDGDMVYARLFFRTNRAGWTSLDYSYSTSALPLPEITTPTDTTQLVADSATFNWITNGNYVSNWWLYLGTTEGGNDIYDSGNIDGATLSTTVSNLPNDGSPIYARLYYRGASITWKNADFTYTSVEVPRPTITSPSDSSTLAGDSETFSWQTNGYAVSEWWLYVGTSPGANDIVDSGSLGSATSLMVNNLPTDGSPVHARLYFRNSNGQWESKDFSYTAARPEITSPADEGVLTGSSETFMWNANGVAISEWWLYVGTSPGANDIVDSGSLGSATSLVVNNLPADGSTVYARLYYRNGSGAWKSSDFSYTAVRPEITAPADEGVLTGSSETFMWNANGSTVSEWWLYVGTSPGANDIVDSGSLGSATSLVVNGLPTDGSMVYARLYYRNGSGAWKSSDFSYTAMGPEITAPVDGGTLTGSSETFMWNANGSTVSEWWLYVGTSPGANDIVDSGSLGSTTSLVVNGLPTDGSMVYARLYYRNGSGLWRQRDFSYTASN